MQLGGQFMYKTKLFFLPLAKESNELLRFRLVLANNGFAGSFLRGNIQYLDLGYKLIYLSDNPIGKAFF